ncbi:MAG TPA: fasciclin domain-containing protein [Candidatus Paceibacterota bacterium]|nr:fasciclin domain-containing protein [Candidatus Paceibacterota bacterium]
MHRNWWILIGVVIVVALVSWWLAATRPFNPSTTTGEASSTPATSTTQVQAFTATNSMQHDTVQGILAALPNAAQFQQLFAESGLSSSIKAGGQYTIFVPTDAAFAQLPKTTLTKMTEAQKKQLVAYHIVAGSAINANAEVAGDVRALSGDLLNFTRINNVPMVDSAIILSAYKGTNGVVYVISAVLIPPKK